MNAIQQPDTDISHCSSLVELLRYRAANSPDKDAFIFESINTGSKQTLCYGELDRMARCIAARIQTNCLPGERALLLYPPGLDFITAFFGCLYSGVVAVPAYPPRDSRSAARLHALAEDVQASLVFSTTLQLSDIERRLPTNELWFGKCQVVASDVLRDGDTMWREILPDTDTLAFIQYTSGSTGNPKGVMVSHRNVLSNERGIQVAFGHTRDSVGVGWLPLFHDMGLIGNVLQSLYVGFPVVLLPPVAFVQNPLVWLQLISQYHATTSGGPNFAYEHCINKITDQQKVDLDLSCWEVAFNGAEPIRAETLDRFTTAFASCGFRKEAFFPCYGMAETTLFLSGGRRLTLPKTSHFKRDDIKSAAGHTTAYEQEQVSCGFSRFDQKILIVNPQTLIPCPDEHVGEIWTSGPSVAQGYWNRPEETKKIFQAYLADNQVGPFLRTGDLGIISKGELYVTGRHKDLIIIRGRNHYPQDIEQTVEQSHLSLNPGGAAAFSIEVGGEEQLVVISEVKRSALRTVSTEDVCACIRRAVLQQHELNMYAILLIKTNSIFRTSSGKIQRHLCRAGYLSAELKTIGQWCSDAEPKPGDCNTPPLSAVADRETIENWLVIHIAKKTNLTPTQIDLCEPLAAYGLDSLDVVSLSGELEKWLGKKLSPTLVYDYPTIESLARYLAGEAEPQGYPVSAISTSYSGRPNEPIAVIGMGCRFPGASNPKAFWLLLADGIDAITAVPLSRWDSNRYPVATRHGGFLDTIDLFDPLFFGISPREAECMDPQQRLLLEVTWEALENAFLPPDRIAGTQTGVFIGISSHDYSHRQLGKLAVHMGTGNAQSIAANRISYTFDLRGPSWTVDTACSSSLVAIHQACQSLRHRESNTAIAGGVNVMLSPDLSCIFSQAGMLAEDGRCKTFDVSADGYVRGEGCGVVILKRLSDALADGSPILALIRGSAINQDGRSNGLTAPNGLSQQAVIRAALDNGGIHPAQVGYVEAHGTGTFLGDHIEYNSLAAVLSHESSASPCYVGSVKTNIGHLEAAAGIAGFIKSVLMLGHAQIPQNLHLKELNPHLLPGSLPFIVPRRLEHWTQRENPRIAGVSSFGFGGTNAHVVVQEAPPAITCAEAATVTSHLLVLSARDESTLTTLAQRYELFLHQHEKLLPQICARAATGREHFEQRLAVIGETAEHLRQGIAAFLKDSSNAWFAVGRAPQQAPKLVFLFSAQSFQDVHMGRVLYEKEPLFRATIDRCAKVADPLLPIPLLKVLYSKTAEIARINESVWKQPALFALEYSLAELWRSWGVSPDAVLGHGLGEYTAACIAGVFTLEDGMRLVIERGRLIQEEFEEVVDSVIFSPPKKLLVSNLTGTICDEIASPAYLGCLLRQPDRYHDGVVELERLGFKIFLEIGPKLPITRLSSDSVLLSSLQHGVMDQEGLLGTLAELYTRGVQVNWQTFHREKATWPCPVLPNYPYQRKRYWREEHSEKPTLVEERGLLHPLLGRRLHSPLDLRKAIFEANFGKALPAYLNDYRIQEMVVFPSAAFIEMVLAAATSYFRTECVQLAEVAFISPLISPHEKNRIVHTIIDPEDKDKISVKIYSCNNNDKVQEPDWTLHVSANISPLEDEKGFKEITSAPGGVEVENYYQHCSSQGFDHGELFQGIQNLRRDGNYAQGDLILRENFATEADTYRIHPVLLDASLQVVWSILPEEFNLGIGVWGLVALRSLSFYQSPGKKVVSKVRLKPPLDPKIEGPMFDLAIEKEDGDCILRVEGLSLCKMSLSTTLEIEKRDEELFSFAQRVSGKSGTELHTLLLYFFRDSIAELLGLKRDELFPDRPLNTLGFDSIMALQLINRVQKEIGLKLSLVEIMEGMTLQDLSATVLSYLKKNSNHLEAFPNKSEQPLDSNLLANDFDPAEMLVNLHHLSDDEVRELLSTIFEEE